jgi:hypothetical protein
MYIILKSISNSLLRLISLLPQLSALHYLVLFVVHITAATVPGTMGYSLVDLPTGDKEVTSIVFYYSSIDCVRCVGHTYNRGTVMSSLYKCILLHYYGEIWWCSLACLWKLWEGMTILWLVDKR